MTGNKSEAEHRRDKEPENKTRDQRKAILKTEILKPNIVARGCEDKAEHGVFLI